MNSGRILICILAAMLCACTSYMQRSHVVLTVPEQSKGGKEPTDGDYWALRYTYPTMEFDSRWMQEANIQHDSMQVAKPAGARQKPEGSGNGDQSDGVEPHLDPNNPEVVYGGTDWSGPFGPYFGVSEPWNSDRRPFLFPFEIYKHACPGSGCAHLIAGSYRVWETIEGAIPSNTWYPNSPDLTKGVLADRSIINQRAFAISDESIAIIGTNDGNVQYGFNLGQGTANTATWVDVTDGNMVLPNRPILDVFTDPEAATTGHAAVGGFE